MDENKQIEGMAKDSGGCDYPHRPCEKCWCREEKECSAYAYAESFYNRGYRKIPEGAVVLTREEKQEYENLIKLLIYDKPIKSRVYEVIKGLKDQARKETAREIIEYVYRTTANIVLRDKLAKQFGVEVEE